MPRNITVHLPNGRSRTYQGVPDNVTVAQMRDRIAQDFPGQRMVTPPAAPKAAPAPLPKTSVGGALWRGIEDAVPAKNYLQALANEAGSKLGLNDTPSSMSYLDRVRALKGQGDQLEDADRQQHPIAHYVGEGGSLVIGGGGVGAGAKAVLGRVAPKAAVAFANVLQRSRAARIATASAGGGTAASAYAAGDANPENAGSAAAKAFIPGAIAAPVLGAVAQRLPGLGLRLARFVTSPFTKAMAVPDAARALGTITNATADDMAAAADKFRAANSGAEPTLFQLLPLADRNKLTRGVLAKSDNVAEQASEAIDGAGNRMGRQMASHVESVVEPQRDRIQAKLLDDLAAARGGTNAPEDMDLAARAINSPTDMSELRDVEAKAIMAPHEATPVAERFSDILPQVPRNAGNGKIEMVDGDPAITAAIKSAAPGGFRAGNQGVTAGDVSDMVQTLRKDFGRGGIEGRTAQQAVEHLEGVLGDASPEAAAAHQQMTDAYAARSRMLEGMDAGHATQLRDNVQVGTDRKAARLVRNSYDTPEGQAGLLLGQSNRLTTDLGGSWRRATGTIADMADNDIGPQIEQNLGPDAAGKITEAAQLQAKSAQALAQASGKISGGVGDAGDALHTAVQAAAALHPSSYPSTKLGAIQKLRNLVGMPENRARTMVDMLFSQDPAMTQRAINALGDNGAAMVKYMAGLGGVVGAQPATMQDAKGAGSTVASTVTAPFRGAPAPAPAAPAAPVDNAAVPAPAAPAAPVDNAGGEAPLDPSDPYASVLQHVRSTENPEFISLIDRQFQQESGNHQTDPKTGKPVTSKKGALGQAQVMPGTGPEGAAYWGLPWDPDLLRTSASYNRLVGMGYMAKQLQKYGGNVPKALSAYNHGPTGTDNAIRAGGDSGWLGNVPAETQQYVQSIAQ